MAERYLKQVLVLRKDLSMSAGKAATMAAHAAMTFLIKKLRYYQLKDGSEKTFASCYLTPVEARWLTECDPGLEDVEQISMAKITCSVTSEAELLAIEQKAMDAGLCVRRVIDSGYSHNKPGTLAAIAVGPDWPEKLDPITGGLPLYK